MIPRPKSELSEPASPRFIAITVLTALVLNLLPFESGVLVWCPDFVALVVLYWCVQQPRDIGMGAAWTLGLVMDVANGSLFGQHALTYTVTAFLALFLNRRIQMFTPWQQALHVWLLLLLQQILTVLVRLFAGDTFPGWAFFLGSLLGALLWPTLRRLLRQPVRQADAA